MILRVTGRRFKGSILPFIEIVAGLIIVAAIFIPFQFATRDVMLNWSLNNTVNQSALDFTIFLDNVWSTMIIIGVVFALFLYGIAQAQKRTET